MNIFSFDKKKTLEEAIDQNFNLFRSLQKKGKVSDESLQFYQESLNEAGQSLIDKINPIAVMKNLPFKRCQQELILNCNIQINNERLVRSLQDEAKIILYGLTLNYDQELLLIESNYDYALNQFQFMLSKSMLLNMGKTFFNSCKELYVDQKLMRYAIFQHDSEKNDLTKNLWSPQQIAMLIPELNNYHFPIKANEKGCLQPLFSIVGIMTAQNAKSNEQNRLVCDSPKE